MRDVPDAIHLPASKPKSRALAPCPRLRLQLAAALRAERELSVHSQSASSAWATQQAARSSVALGRAGASLPNARRKRIFMLAGKLRQSQVHRMDRAAAQASTSYGSGAMGASARDLKGARFHRASGPSQWLSTVVMLQVSEGARLEPAHDLNVSPLLSSPSPPLSGAGGRRGA
eukprot:5887573-Pyramimonas_sp.AAC.1